MTKHLYIHIPFCASICTYCDFTKFKAARTNPKIGEYIKLIKQKISEESIKNQYSTIYIGGGTPNILEDDTLDDLLSFLNTYLDTDNDYEFCIELNPELVTDSQCYTLAQNKINRVSIGIQTTNNKILTALNRKHNIQDVASAIKTLYKYQLYNVSADFMYGLPNLTHKDIAQSLAFIRDYKIPHISYYSLEVNPGTSLYHEGFEVDDQNIEEQLEQIKKGLKDNGYNRYEVANWSISKKTESMHNKAYWLSADWKAVGLSGSGFENRVLYKYEGTLLDWKKVENKLSTKDYYLQILMMGLRLTEGIDVDYNKTNSEAYKMYFDDIVNCHIRDHKLRCLNIDMLHDSLVNIVDETPYNQLEEQKKELEKVQQNEFNKIK